MSVLVYWLSQYVGIRFAKWAAWGIVIAVAALATLAIDWML